MVVSGDGEGLAEIPFEQLVVRHKRHTASTEFDIVAHGGARVNRVFPAYLHIADADRGGSIMMKFQCRLHVFHLDGKIGTVQLPLEDGFQIFVDSGGSIQLDIPGIKAGRKKGKPWI